MPGLRGYVNRRLPEYMSDLNNIWNRGRLGTASQHDRKLMNQRRAGRDPKTSQWDWLYGGQERPGVFGGATQTGRQKEQLSGLHRFGYNPSPGTRFDPSQGTLGGIRQVVGTRPFGGEWWNDIAAKGGGGGALGEYRSGVIGDLMKPRNPYARIGGSVNIDYRNQRGRESPGLSMGFSPDRDLEDRPGGLPISETQTPLPGGSSTPRRVNAPLGGGSPTIGAPMTPMAQAIQLAMEEATLGDFGQQRALRNLGIYGPAGMQSILEQVEGPENQMLADLPGRTENLISQNALRGADARRQMLRGMDVGRAGAQRPGLGAQMVAEATIPQRMAESQYAGDITEAGYNMADQISLGQGQRRGDFMQENMQSRMMDLGSAGAFGQAQGMLGSRYWDTEDPMNKQLKMSSFMADKMAGFDRDMQRRAQRFKTSSERVAFLDKYRMMRAEFAMRAYYEQWLKNSGLGDYYESGADYIDAFMPDSISLFGKTG